MKNIAFCLAIVIVTVIGTLGVNKSEERILDVEKVVKSIISFFKN
jgi:hypothetical protein